jgi:hypothetical protein
MQYRLYNSEDEIEGTFNTLNDLELHLDDVRNSRGENRHNSPIHTTLDYIKSIGWHFDIIDSSQSGTK